MYNYVAQFNTMMQYRILLNDKGNESYLRNARVVAAI